MKIIRLTESDLTKIVKTVIKEQATLPFKTREEGNAFRKWLNDTYPGIAKEFQLDREGSHTNAYIKNAFNGKIGKSNRTWGDYFLTLKKLYAIPGTSTGTSGKLTGTSGKTTAPSNEKEEEGFFSSLAKNVVDKVKSFTIDANILPLHMRAFLNFLKLRTSPLTINDLTSTERAALKQMVDYAQKKGLIRSGKTVNFYGIANALNAGTEKIDFKDPTLGINQTDIKSDYTKVAMTIGNAVVNKSGDKYIVKDIYDFNNYANNPEQYTWEKTPETIRKAVGKLNSDNYVQGLEELASYYQKFGYSGYPVELEV
jgi:hypothetical protein